MVPSDLMTDAAVQDALDLRFDRPAETWFEAAPIGNGNVGAMVFGGTALETLTLNDDTFWSGYPRDGGITDAPGAIERARRDVLAGRFSDASETLRAAQGPWAQSYLPLADLSLSFPGIGEASEYTRLLDLGRGLASVEFVADGHRHRREVFASAPAGGLAMRLWTDDPRGVRFDARVHSPLPYRVEHLDGTMYAVAKAWADMPSRYPYRPEDAIPDPRLGHGMHGVAGVRVLGAEVDAADDGAGLTVRGGQEVIVLIATATGYRGRTVLPDAAPAECIAAAADVLDAMTRISYRELRTAHVDDHSALMRRTTLRLGGGAPDPLPTTRALLASAATDETARQTLIALMFRYGRYLLVASSRAGTQPANLEGIWTRSGVAFTPGYTVNINTQMNYWGAEATGLAECHTPLLEFVRDLAAAGSRTAADVHAASGAAAHHNSDLWAHTDPVGAGSGSPSWAFWPMGLAWLSHHLWERFEFGGDVEELRRDYSVLRSSADFLLSLLGALPDGSLGTAPSTSPENTFVGDREVTASAGVASTMDVAITRQVFDDTIRAAEILGVDAGLRRTLRETSARLSEPRIGSRGQLLEWVEEYAEHDPSHRHVSHLFGFYPGDVHRGDPELERAARIALDERGDDGTGWSIVWKAALRGRLGDGDRADALLTQALRLTDRADVAVSGGGVYLNLLCAHPPFQIDGNLGFLAGALEQLIHADRDAIRVLPSLPSRWTEGAVRGVRTKGGSIVDVVWREGRLHHAIVTTTRDGEHEMRYGGRVRRWTAARGRSYRFDSVLAVSEESTGQ